MTQPVIDVVKSKANASPLTANGVGIVSPLEHVCFVEYFSYLSCLSRFPSACTYQGPSFKRGPPKGYIHAIEQRWHQVECILGTIMASPRARDIVNDLRQDAFARDVLDRVDAGPYVSPRGISLSVAMSDIKFNAPGSYGSGGSAGSDIPRRFL